MATALRDRAKAAAFELKILLVLLALSGSLWADAAVMKIVSVQATPANHGRSVITFKIKNVSERAILLGSELGSTGYPYTNIRHVYEIQEHAESPFFTPYSPNLIAKPCHGPQELQSVAPNETVSARLELYGDWSGKKLALMLMKEDGEFLAGTFVGPKK